MLRSPYLSEVTVHFPFPLSLVITSLLFVPIDFQILDISILVFCCQSEHSTFHRKEIIQYMTFVSGFWHLAKYIQCLSIFIYVVARITMLFLFFQFKIKSTYVVQAVLSSWVQNPPALASWTSYLFWLRNIPFPGYTIICLSILHSMDAGTVFTFWVLYIMLL